MTTELRERLQQDIFEADWTSLQRHAEREGLILVSSALDLVEVGVAVALDQTQQVQEWLIQGNISKPSPEQIETWNESPTLPFRFVIVQPFVLAQGPPLQ